MTKKNSRILWEVNGEIVATVTDYNGLTIREDFLINLYPKRVIFNNPATIVFWNDDSKTVVKCSKDDTFDNYKGFTMAYLKRIMGSGKKAERFIDENEFNYIEKGFIQELIDELNNGRGF